MRQFASPRTDYLVLVAPLLAIGSILTAVYAIRMKGIRASYLAQGRTPPDWWHGSEVIQNILTKGGTNQGKLELVVLIMAGIAGLVSSWAMVRIRRN